MKIHHINPPEGLLTALKKARLNYSSAECLLYLVWVDRGVCAGVFGDPDNAAYEWFVWREGKLTHSNAGYGESAVALNEVMKAEMNFYV